MKRIQLIDDIDRPVLRSALGYVQAFSRSRIGLLVLGGGALALAAGLSWGWLVAAGIAPILLALLPCAAMCALGLCMPGMGRKTTDAPKAAPEITLQARPVASRRLHLVSSGNLPDPLVAARQPAMANASDERSCCHPSDAKENLDAKNI